MRAGLATSPTADLYVVAGAGTCLGAEVVGQLLDQNMPLVLATRHSGDADKFAQRYPGVTQLGKDTAVPDLVAAAAVVRYIVCAFGPVHPQRPDWDRDMADFAVDLRLARMLLETWDGPVHAVLVSTVLALAPTRDRCHYGGLKNLAESQLAQLLAHRTSASMSVLYPGRLVAGKSLLGTSYVAMARIACAVAAQPASCLRVIGLDARLWLLRQAAISLGLALTSRVANLPIARRDGEPNR